MPVEKEIEEITLSDGQPVRYLNLRGQEYGGPAGAMRMGGRAAQQVARGESARELRRAAERAQRRALKKVRNER